MIRQSSEYKASGAAQHDAEQFAYATLDALVEHVAVLDERGTVVAVNKAWREFAGMNSASPEGLSEGANYFTACERATGEDAADAARFAAGLRAVVGGELEEFSLEYPCHSPTGRRWFIARATRFELDGEVRAVVTHADNTSRKLAEQRLAQSEEQLRAIFDASRDGILVEDGAKIFYTNRAYARMIGYNDPDELRGRHVSSVVAPEDARRMMDYGLLRLAGGTPPTVYEFKGMCKDGSFVDLEASVSTHAVAGKTYITTSVRDISGRKRAEDSLKQLSNKIESQLHTFDTVVSSVQDFIYMFDLQGRFTYINKPLLDLFQKTFEQAVGKNFHELDYPPDVADKLQRQIQEVIASRRPLKDETPYTSALGTRGYEYIFVPLISAGGAVEAVAGVTRDITERKHAEEALKESESRYRLLMEQASDGIHTYDLEGNFIEVNSKLCEMLGYTCEELLRLNVRDLIPAEDITDAPIRFDELQDGKTLLVERRLRRKDGTLLSVEISGRMIQDGVLQSIVRDISERKRAEGELREAYDELERRVEERTDELARTNEALKAEIAERRQAEESRRRLLGLLVNAQEEERWRISRELHDRMGQQLAALLMGLKTLDGESYGRQSALATLRQLQEITDQLSREAHTLAWGLRPPTLDELGLHTALYNHVEEWAERSRVPVDFHSAGFDDGVRLSPAHETAIYRIAQEALTNVLKHSGADRVSFILERRGDHVLVVVEDNGKGFDVEALTGSSVKERRLGLLGMRERAALLGGTLNVESAPDAGTSVFVRIPVGTGREEAREEAREEGGVARG